MLCHMVTLFLCYLQPTAFFIIVSMGKHGEIFLADIVILFAIEAVCLSLFSSLIQLTYFISRVGK